MASGKTRGMPGNSTYNPINRYQDTMDPGIIYTGEQGGKGPTRNRWHITYDNSEDKVGPFTTLSEAWAYAHRGNGYVPPVMPTPLPPAAEPTPEPPVVEDLPLLRFKCPSCGHSLVGLVAAE